MCLHSLSHGEPTREAEADWLDTIAATSRSNGAFLEACTPGYYNKEGMPTVRAQSYSPGPIAFHKLLRDWRSTDMADVLGTQS